MENIYIAYALGISTVILIGMIVGIVRANIKVNNVDTHVKELDRGINERVDMLQRDKKEVHMRMDLLESRISREAERINYLHSKAIGHTDSRVDKLEEKLKNQEVVKPTN